MSIELNKEKKESQIFLLKPDQYGRIQTKTKESLRC